ncbi:oxidoreductase [Aliidongia dinghuensis]|uniref:Oxidoreductase n=1 Tax=Aliidongia dinghuensis TaxID=1867774 RepID=A0A8J2YYJ9_9PROT|nr:MBL fold metallo-hydrolase [Aliidongia dinghuensis]GGF41337.1 oxidoreductase [Aliidongia dinghuensis]
MAKTFASQADLAEKQETFQELAPGAYCLTAEGDPNTGVVIGDDGVMVIDARATPLLARDLIERIRQITDKPIRYVLLTHYHAVRVMGASAYGAEQIIASDLTLDLIRERGRQDFESEVQRFPRLFKAVETVPGLTWPSLVFKDELTLFMGQREVQIRHIGAGHTKGDTIVYLPDCDVLYSGDLVEEGATPYCGDAYFTRWPATLDRLAAFEAKALVPGRGAALIGTAAVKAGIAATRGFLADLTDVVRAGVGAGKGLRAVYEDAMAALRPRYGHWVIFEHCMPFNVSRCFDEMSGITDPRVWTAERDAEMWRALEG